MSECNFSDEDVEILQKAIAQVESSSGSYDDKFQFYQNAFNKHLLHILLKGKQRKDRKKDFMKKKKNIWKITQSSFDEDIVEINNHKYHVESNTCLIHVLLLILDELEKRNEEA